MSRTKSYFEFGCGGSTLAACDLVSQKVVSVDSSYEWISSIGAACQGKKVAPDLRLIDIGPVGDWGAPLDQNKRELWPSYSQAVLPGADLYLIDGRFRVACFISTLLVADSGAFIAFHDFDSRPNYHLARKLCTEVVREGDLSIFVKNAQSDLMLALSSYDEFKYELH